MTAIVLVGLALVVAAVVVVAGVERRRLSRRVHDVLALLAPGEPRRGEPYDDALARLERAAERAQAVHRGHEQTIGRLAAAVDALPVGLVVVDADGAPVVRNAAAGHPAGAHHADALVLDAVAAMLRDAPLQGPHDRTVELYGPPRRTVVVHVAPFRGGALAVIEDVTERVRLEAMRTDFVANISHELKTPVGALALLAETLVDEDDPDVARRLGERMVEESHRVGRIVDDLLELSRLEGHAGIQRNELDLAAVVGEACGRVRQLAESHDVRVHTERVPGHLGVLGDRRQLVSAVANLVDNAIKYSPAGTTVELSAVAVSDGDEVELTVRDRGIGIPQRDLDRIFERFYRADRGRGRDTGGTGLGLAIVRHVATNHGGRVTVQSQEGVGSAFTLRLPAVPGAVSPPTAVTAVPSGKELVERMPGSAG